MTVCKWKASIAERLDHTVKSTLFKFFTKNYNWKSNVNFNGIINKYKNSFYESIKMKPT